MLLIVVSLINTSIFSIRTCTEDEMYDYYEDPESLTSECVPPAGVHPKKEYVYNTNCPEGSKCVRGNECGAKGTYSYS